MKDTHIICLGLFLMLILVILIPVVVHLAFRVLRRVWYGPAGPPPRQPRPQLSEEEKRLEQIQNTLNMILFVEAMDALDDGWD
jgi:hypothetical protein